MITPTTTPSGLPKLVLDIPELCEVFRKSRGWIFGLLKSGALPSVKIAGARYVRTADLIAYVGDLEPEPVGEEP